MSGEKFRIKGENKTMIVYDDKVVLEGEKGFFAAAVGVNQGQKTFPYESISSIEFVDATLVRNGVLTFLIQGDRGVGGAIGIGKAIIGYDNDNAFVYVKRSLNDEVSSAKSFIENQMIKSKQASRTVVNTLSPADELRKFKQLLDDGIINQAEFDEKKKQLL